MNSLLRNKSCMLMEVKRMSNNRYWKLSIRVLKQAFRTNQLSYLFYMIVGALVGVEMFFFLRLTEETTNASYAVYQNPNADLLETLEPVILVLIVLLSFQVLKGLHAIIGHSVKRDIQTGFELSVLNKLATLKWEDYEDHEFQMKLEMINRRGSVAFQNLAVDMVGYIVNTTMYIGIYVYIVAKLNVVIGLVFLLSTSMYFFIGWYFGRKLYLVHQKTNKSFRRMWYLYKSGENKEVHQDQLVNRLYGFITSRYLDTVKEASVNDIKGRTRINLYVLLPNLVFACIAGWLMYVVIVQMEQGIKDIGYFGMIVTTIINYRNTLTSFSTRMQWTERNFNVYQDYTDLMDKESDYVNTEQYLPDNFEISFEEVTYTYIQSEHQALNKLSLQLKSHETVAIVGVNGSGKTTFVNVLSELSKRYTGTIKVNNQPIDHTMGVLRNSISCIFQDFVEFQVSIRENVSIGDVTRDISDDEIWEILDKVKLKEFILELPDQLDTILGQVMEGTELSKGQWQRLAVARLLANKSAKIWVLDEPTAFLDPIAEIEMYDFIYSLKEDRSVIFISHRLGFAKKADRIIVFKDGNVAESGSHQLLMKQNGEYASMFQKQKTWYE